MYLYDVLFLKIQNLVNIAEKMQKLVLYTNQIINQYSTSTYTA